MKKHLSKKALRLSFLSAVTLGIFIVMAETSEERHLKPDLVYLGDGVYEKTEYEDDIRIVTTGKRDDNRKWDGPVTIKHIENDMATLIEEVQMRNGKRDGKGTHIIRSYTTGEIIDRKDVCYKMDEPIDCKELARKSMADVSSFQVLSNRFPWYLYTLNTFGFDDEYVDAYMDTLETLLATYEFNETMFDNYYQEVIDSLGYTVYDSLIVLNSDLSFFKGLEELKNDQLRMAVIDRYRSDGNTTYNILNTTYPGYVFSMTDAGVNDQDVEGFCQELDSLMSADDAVYGTLEQEDPFFLDSVDARLFRAFSSILDTEESSSKAMQSMKSLALFPDKYYIRSMWGKVSNIFSTVLLKSDPAVVADYVMLIMFFEFDQGDIIKRSVREAYLTNNGVVRLPTVTTELSNHNSASSVTLNGYVHGDGGAEVTARGIAWAEFYNPTTADHAETSGTGLGTFSVDLNDLIEGNTYYARTFATNSAGTAYGNCVEFTAEASVGVIENELMTQDLNVYPNPASALATFSFNAEFSENLELTIINLKGQAVYHNNLAGLPPGDHQIKLDLSGLQNGIYTCRLTNNGTIKGMCKLVISR